MEAPEINKERLLRDLNAVSRIGLGEGGSVTRLAFSAHEMRARQLLVHLMRRAGLHVRVDAVGNVFGRLPGTREGPAVLAGSHLDSVVRGGKFDGPVGVMGALEAVRTLKENDVRLPAPLESVCFVGEESSRFGFATLGSSLVAGEVAMDDFANAVDARGVRVEDVLSGLGIHRGNLASLKRDPKSVKAYVELHIEQGPVLESRRKKVGVVTAIAAPSRFRVVFHGHADHSGATPMEMRKDALVAAARLITFVDEVCRERAAGDRGGVVGTVGAIEVEPGVINSIPGRVELLVDVRSVVAASKRKAARRIESQARRIARERGMEVEIRTIRDEDPVALHPRVVSLIRSTCEERGVPFEVMPSGAGHDAMQMARVAPTGMIFIPSVDGVSHNPAEWTDPEDVCLGTQLLADTLVRAAHATI